MAVNLTPQYHEAEAAYKKSPELASEAATGRTARAIRALQLETELRTDPQRRADRFVERWRSLDRASQHQYQAGDMSGYKATRSAMGDMAKSLERDPQLESILEGRKRDLGIGIDLCGTEAIAAAVAATRAKLASIGGLVHAAGVSLAVPLEELDVSQWDAVLNVNLRALPFLVKAIRADLVANPGSSVVGIASINATLGNWMNPAYTASKGGMLSLVRSLADDLGRHGVRVNSVSPGQIRTPMMKPVLDTLSDEAFSRRILLGRIGEPREIASVVRFLLSDEASYVTAAEIVVDGGNISSQRI